MPLVQCPACNARYNVPDSVAGKRARCKKCGATFKIPETPPDSGRLTLTGLDTPSGEMPVARVPEAPPPEALQYARAEPGPSTGLPDEGLRQGAAPTRGYGPYFGSLARSLIFPANPRNLITFLALLILLTFGRGLLNAAASTGICFFILGTLLLALIIESWYVAFQLNTVLSGAAGENDLPSLSFSEGWFDDVIRPFFRMIATYVMARLPATIFLVLLATSRPISGAELTVKTLFFLFGDFTLLLEQPGLQTQLIAGVLLLGGFFLWPMFVLIVAVGSVGGLVRIDLMVITIVKSLPVYLITVIIVFAAQAIGLVSTVVSTLVGFGAANDEMGLGVLLLVPLLSTLVSLYFTIVAMCMIGFYYHHFKHKFAWSWG